VSKSREHIVPLCLAPELRMGLIRFQANKELGETYAALLLLTKALYQEQVISREDYERFTQRYSCKLVPPPVPRKLTSAEMAEQQKLEEKRRWFEMAKAEFHKDHRRLSSGRTWREDILAEAEKYKEKLPVAAEILAMGS
jgi:hypothetical protein